MHRLIPSLCLALSLIGCAGTRSPEAPAFSPSEALKGFGVRGGVALEQDAYGDSAAELIYLDQGWGPAETLWYYHADQGSALLPYALMMNLEQADSAAPFIEATHMARFRFLPQHATPNNPDALPVGMARHGDQVGLTCAACHTGQINYKGTGMRIDGAPSMLDMIGFLHEVRRAIAATLADEAKLARFTAAASKSGTEAERAAAARAMLSESLAWLDGYNSVNDSSTVEGFGRLDAIGRIVNQVIRFSSDAKNGVPVTAPASFPVLWDAARHDYVQWVGFAPNAGAGGLGRNAGEVIGVFGHVEVVPYASKKEAKKGYESTVDAHGLVSMEAALYDLESPRWPEGVLGPIDTNLAARGAQLYQASCASCHAVLDRDDPDRAVVAMITGLDVVGTDPTEAQNLAGAVIPTGKLEGSVGLEGQTFGAQISALGMLKQLVGGTLARHPDAVVRAIAYAKANGLDPSPKQGQYTPKSEANPTAELLAYKARPLNGVWASAPYLHNGSVPTLADLLLPPAQRPATFSVGRLEYDPVRVGYVQDGAAPFVVDTAVKGNSNQGHLFGTTLAEDDRRALLEYLKTL